MPKTKTKKNPSTEKTADEMRAVVEDIQKSADARVAAFESELGVRVEDAVAEALRWVETGKGDSVENFVDSDGSIFEQYASINESTKGVEKVKEGNLLEGDWTSAGLSPYYEPKNAQTIEKLRLQQSASLYQYINFPIAHSEIENMKRYVLGRGVRVDCLVEPVMKVISNFWKQNGMEKRIKSSFQMYLIDGEYFPLLFSNYSQDFNEDIDPLLLFRSIPSAEIDEIEVDADDWETRLAYKRVRATGVDKADDKIYIDISHVYGDEKELGLPTTFNKTISSFIGEAEDPSAVRVVMWKHGLEYDLRGRVFLESVLRWNRVAVDFLYSRARLNHLRSKIYLIETRSDGPGKRSLSSTVTERMPQGGMKLVETSGRKYRLESPNTGADEAATDYKALLYMIGSALSMPIHILQVNAENENYASIKEAGNPFAQAVQDMQDEFGENLRVLLRYLVTMGVRTGVLEKEYTVEYLPDDVIGEVKALVNERLKAGADVSTVMAEANVIVKQEKKVIRMQTVNIPLSIVFPSIIQTDPTKEAQALKVYMDLGLMSKYTAQLRIGVDPEVENSRMDVEFSQSMARREAAMKSFDNGSPDADKNAVPDSTGKEGDAGTSGADEKASGSNKKPTQGKK